MIEWIIGAICFLVGIAFGQLSEKTRQLKELQERQGNITPRTIKKLSKKLQKMKINEDTILTHPATEEEYVMLKGKLEKRKK